MHCFLLSILREREGACVCLCSCVCLSFLSEGTQGSGPNISCKAAQTKLAACPFQVKTDSFYSAASFICLFVKLQALDVAVLNDLFSNYAVTSHTNMYAPVFVNDFFCISLWGILALVWNYLLLLLPHAMFDLKLFFCKCVFCQMWLFIYLFQLTQEAKLKNRCRWWFFCSSSSVCSY